jgi:hypothetical protein
MHPLSVEDLLNQSGHALSKADYYPKHLFIRILCHTIDPAASASQNSKPVTTPQFTNLPLSASLQHLDEKLGMEDESAYGSGYEDDVDPKFDTFGTASATLHDPEMGGRRASLLVSYESCPQRTEFFYPLIFSLEGS